MAEEGHEGVVKLLMAQEDVDVELKDKNGWTLLLYAAECGNGEVLKLLMVPLEGCGCPVREHCFHRHRETLVDTILVGRQDNSLRKLNY
jgi:ankyrin repeat protein